MAKKQCTKKNLQKTKTEIHNVLNFKRDQYGGLLKGQNLVPFILSGGSEDNAFFDKGYTIRDGNYAMFPTLALINEVLPLFKDAILRSIISIRKRKQFNFEVVS